MKNICFFLLIALLTSASLQAEVRKRYNFNSGWKLCVGDPKGAEQPSYDDASWESVTLPHAFNEDDAFRVAIDKLTTGVAWYRKRFLLPSGGKGQKVLVEFEGIRQAGEFFINGTSIGLHENGVMAVGFDLTRYVRFGKENVIAVRIDNSWDYKEKSTGAKFQWNDRNFNANYGGIPKNVYLHLAGKLYQTLPLFSDLGTTGVYIYADSIDVGARTATIHAESEVRNEHPRPVKFSYMVEVKDMDGATVGRFSGEEAAIAPGETKAVKASAPFSNLNFWSWGYGYLYTVETALLADGREVDRVKTRTGFRKTRFADGMVWLNDRVIQVKGYAQRASNEWPAVGMSAPAWLSDYSNGLMVESNANLVRWMHVTPWRQDVESCDRVGLMQAMPAGDAEKDVADARWGQRTRLMRDAIIYNRNSPSIIFYESGNESISEEHMAEMKAIRDRYDPHGGRAIGSREMLDSRVAEYGGEMLYINKSGRIPMWATEYSRDEGLRKYWDSYSYPYHRDGDGPLYHSADASAYNRNQDSHAVENIIRWFDYWRERPGTGRRVSSGGVKIIFSDSNTHFRGAENYRRSGVTDPMRIPKDGFFAHRVMWDGWVDVENPRTHIVGHWNYADSVVKDIFVVSGGCERVELLVNGASKGFGSKSHEFLYTFKNIAFEKGELKAVAYSAQGQEVSSDVRLTAGAPEAIRLKLIQGEHGFYADGADMALVEAEVVDGNGRRCPLANDEISFELSGPAEWRGGIAQGVDNYILSKTLPVECGVNRALIRSTSQAGQISLTASSGSLKPASVDFASTSVDNLNGFSKTIQAEHLSPAFRRGATPRTPSYAATRIPVEVKSATAGANSESVANSYDDNELSEWRNDGIAANGWIRYELEREAKISEVALKLTGWRTRSYPISIFADNVLVFSGNTEKSLGYATIPVKEVKAKAITIKLTGDNTEDDAFGQVVELTGAKELDMYGVPGAGRAKGELRIVEVELYESALADRTYTFGKGGAEPAPGAIRVSASHLYAGGTGYGFDLTTPPPNANGACVSDSGFFFSVDLPEGNYDVTLLLGNPDHDAEITVRGESRRLFLEKIKTRKGEYSEQSFTVNIRNKRISGDREVRIKPREAGKLNWDDKLTLEFNGLHPGVQSIRIRPAEKPLTIFLCGNSTVVDQDNEPWCGWGQMIPRFFQRGISFANYAESGEAANTFIAAGRLEKLLTQAKAGDYIFVEFGHNDQKQKGEGKGAWLSYTESLRTFIAEARRRQLRPALIAPVHRRTFDEHGKVLNSHGEYPDAVRKLAADENVPLIDLHKTSATLYEAWGVAASVKAFAHYPAGTFPGQVKKLEDNTHFNAYGGYEIAKCIIEGIRENGLADILRFLRDDYTPFDPAQPDDAKKFSLPPSPFTEVEKPEEN